MKRKFRVGDVVRFTTEWKELMRSYAEASTHSDAVADSPGWILREEPWIVVEIEDQSSFQWDFLVKLESMDGQLFWWYRPGHTGRLSSARLELDAFLTEVRMAARSEKL